MRGISPLMSVMRQVPHVPEVQLVGIRKPIRSACSTIVSFGFKTFREGDVDEHGDLQRRQLRS